MIVSYSKGHKPSNVMIVFGKEPRTVDKKEAEQSFIRALNYELKHDWYKAYAIKCMSEEKIKISQLIKCRKWLQHEFKTVNPYLIILMGNVATISILGNKYKGLHQNIFYERADKKYFIGESIFGSMKKLDTNLKKLLTYIRKYYG